MGLHPPTRADEACLKSGPVAHSKSLQQVKAMRLPMLPAFENHVSGAIDGLESQAVVVARGRGKKQ